MQKAIKDREDRFPDDGDAAGPGEGLVDPEKSLPEAPFRIRSCTVPSHADDPVLGNMPERFQGTVMAVAHVGRNEPGAELRVLIHEFVQV